MPFAPRNAATIMLETSSNPFLSTADNDSLVTKCRVPGCQENTLRDLPACVFHLSHVSPKPATTKVVDNQPRTDAVQTTGRLQGALSAQGRKQLDAKVTARKSAARSFVLPPIKPHGANGTKTNGSSLSPVNRMNTNGSQSSSIPSVSGRGGRSPSGTPSRKRQRISSPEQDSTSPKFARPVLQETSQASYGSYSILNGRDRDLPMPKSYASFLGKEDEQVSTQSQDTKRSTVSGLTAVLSPISVSNGRIPGPSTLVCEPRENYTNRNLANARSASLEKTQWPTPTNSKRREKVAKSPYSGLKFITRTPPLEKQRRCLAEMLDSSALDNLIYGQEASSEPPLGIGEPPEQVPKKQQDVYYGNIDPRTHWTRSHSDEWYRKKQEEIKARGGRKANFGKAAQRMRGQKLNEDPDAWEEHLPDRVRNNEAWLGTMRWLHSEESQPSGGPQANGHVSPVRKKRPYRRRNLGAVPGLEAGPSDPGRLNSELSNTDTDAYVATKTKTARLATRSKPPAQSQNEE